MKHKNWFNLLIVSGIAFASGIGVLMARGVQAEEPAPQNSRSRPIMFVENVGQFDSQATKRPRPST